MSRPSRLKWRHLFVLGGTAYVYFVLFPGDLEAMLKPLETILGVTQAAPFGLYLVIAIGVGGAFALKWRRAHDQRGVASTPPRRGMT